MLKLWMGKKHDRQGPLAYIVKILISLKVFKASYGMEKDRTSWQQKQGANCGLEL